MKKLIILFKKPILKKANLLSYNEFRVNHYSHLLKNYTFKKHFNSTSNIFKKFNNSFLKNGSRLKGLVIISSAFFNFYNVFFKKVKHSKFNKYQDFFIFSKSDSNFFKKEFILARLKDLLSSSFYLKIEKISKKLKKLKKFSKIKYKYKVCYMPSSRRVNYLSKQLLIYVNTLKYFGVVVRLTEAINNIILEDKQSDLYKQKINFIRRFKK